MFCENYPNLRNDCIYYKVFKYVLSTRNSNFFSNSDKDISISAIAIKAMTRNKIFSIFSRSETVEIH